MNITVSLNDEDLGDARRRAVELITASLESMDDADHHALLADTTGRHIQDFRAEFDPATLKALAHYVFALALVAGDLVAIAAEIPLRVEPQEIVRQYVRRKL